MSNVPDEDAARRAEFDANAARRAEFWSLPPEAMVDRETQAAVRFVSLSTIEAEAIRGGGVPYRRVGRRALSTKADILAFMMRAPKVASTAQLAEAAS